VDVDARLNCDAGARRQAACAGLLKRRVHPDGHEFVRRVLLRVLPTGIKRIRHYGVLAAAARSSKRRGRICRCPHPIGRLSSQPEQHGAKTRLFYRHDGGTFCVSEPIDRESATFANGGTVGFKWISPEQVQQFHDAAIAHGGTSIEEPPGLREGKLGPMHLAYVRDPDGNKLCALHRPK
jgi:catechol 2,3-dioxygenase-like lactoylglutathione lyase family enzyme